MTNMWNFCHMLGYSVPAAEDQTGSAELMGRLLPLLSPPERLHHGRQGHLGVQEDHYSTGEVEMVHLWFENTLEFLTHIVCILYKLKYEADVGLSSHRFCSDFVYEAELHCCVLVAYLVITMTLYYHCMNV